MSLRIITLGTLLLLFIGSNMESLGQEPKEDSIRFYYVDSLGVSRLFYPNGQVEEEGRFVLKKFSKWKKRKEGVWTSYFENGHIKSEGSYHRGNKTGLWLYYLNSGQPQSVVLYSKGYVIDKVVFVNEIPIWDKQQVVPTN